MPIQTIGKPGTITVNGGAWIGNVTPGSATVPAGGVITITGGGFLNGQVDVTLKGTPISFTVVDDNTILAVPSRAVTMHGAEVLMDVRGNGGARQRLL